MSTTTTQATQEATMTSSAVPSQPALCQDTTHDHVDSCYATAAQWDADIAAGYAGVNYLTASQQRYSHDAMVQLSLGHGELETGPSCSEDGSPLARYTAPNGDTYLVKLTPAHDWRPY